MYSIVDIETTGGSSRSHKIIEVAIVSFDGQQIVDTYSTLINPGKYVPPFITSLTGISNDMIEDAPSFEDVAQEILKRTEGQIFVAHNVNFDFSFLRQEFGLLGIKFERKKLCTVRLARRILPGFKSYGLGALSSALDIQIQGRHRALGDAEATAKILGILIEQDKDGFIGHSLKKNSKEATLPPHMSKEEYDELPEKSGVYYFHNDKGKVVYVGKAKNIKSRVTSHFTGESGGSKRLFHENIHHISYELTGNELIALLLESREIKRLWPEYNRAQKYTSKNHALYLYTDRNGYMRFTVSKMQPGAHALASFSNFQEGRSYVHDLVKKYKLCPKLSGLQKSPGTCFDVHLGSCDGACEGKITSEYYNVRMEHAILSIDSEKKTFAIVGKGRSAEERTFVLIENGMYIGHGFTDHFLRAETFEDLKGRVQGYPDNQDIQKILRLYLKQTNGDQLLYF